MKNLNINYNDTFSTRHSRDYYRGTSFHFSGQWTLGIHYINDEYNIDFVVYNQVLLVCAKSHLSTTDNEPINFIYNEQGTIVGIESIYWDFVLAGIAGRSPGIRIINNYWYICDNTNLPEEQQIWVNTGNKAKLEFSDLTEEDIDCIRRPILESVDTYISDKGYVRASLQEDTLILE